METDGNKSLTANEIETLGAMGRLVAASLMTRKEYLSQAGIQFGGDRDIYDVLGYEETLEFDDYLAKYERQDIAGRIVDMPADDTWREPPTVRDDDGPKGTFAANFNALADRLRLWHYLARLDRRAGIGEFGIMLIGLKGQGTLKTKAQKIKGPEDVIYLSVYDQGDVEVAELVKEPGDPRFGLPKIYKVELGKDVDGGAADTVEVHHSRVIHAAENLGADEVYGRPRLKRIYNRLDDLEKVVGAGAEATWKLIYKGVIASTKEGYTLDDGAAGEESDDRQSEIEEYIHGFRRWLELEGMDVNFEGGEVVDPSGMFGVIIDLVAAGTGIPKRILLGSERGELASTTDAASWAGVVANRQTDYAEPQMLRPFIDRLVGLGALDEPQGGRYDVEWSSPFELTRLEEAELALKVSEAIRNIAPPGSPDLVVESHRFIEAYLPELIAAAVDEEEMLDEEDSDGLDPELDDDAS